MFPRRKTITLIFEAICTKDRQTIMLWSIQHLEFKQHLDALLTMPTQGRLWRQTWATNAVRVWLLST
jgi:hypothetical protein